MKKIQIKLNIDYSLQLQKYEWKKYITKKSNKISKILIGYNIWCILYLFYTNCFLEIFNITFIHKNVFCLFLLFRLFIFHLHQSYLIYNLSISI